MRKIVLCLLVLILAVCIVHVDIAHADEKPKAKPVQKTVATPTVEEALKTNFPDIKAESITPSPVKGLYEVITGQGVLYFAPQEGIIISGNMFDKTKKNLTGERMNKIKAKREQAMAEKAKDLPLDKAVKVGNGIHKIIEFTDPDCPYCRQAAKFFEPRKDITKYTFLFPLPMHPDAGNKARYVLCQQDRGKAFEEVMQGKLDKDAEGKPVKYEVCKSTEVEDLMKLHKSLADKMGVTGTPFFIVDGTVVSGFDIPRFEQLLGKMEKKEGQAGKEPPKK